MNSVIFSVLVSVTITLALSGNATNDTNSATAIGDDVVSCLKDSNLTYEEASGMDFFNPNKSVPRNAKCFAACLIATDYNVSVSSEGVVEKEELLLTAIMQDTDMDFTNATEVVDVCKHIITVKADACENIYNYATCVNQKYFERKGFSNFTGIILELQPSPVGSAQESYNVTIELVPSNS